MMDDIIQDFLMETSENLLQLDIDIVNLEQDNNNAELLGNIFRTIHTIKGTCGFIGLPRLEKVAHHGENVLGRFRDGELEITADAITAILFCVDTIKDIMLYLEKKGSEPDGNDDELIERLDAFTQSAPKDTDNSSDDVDDDKKEENVEKVIEKTDSVSSIVSKNIRLNVNLLENLITSVSELVLAKNQLLQIARESHNDEFKVPLQRLSHITSALQEGLMQTRMQPIGTA